MRELTADRVRELLSYDPATGVLTWRDRPGRGGRKDRVGLPAGSPHKDGYIAVQTGGAKYLAHRLVWLLVTGGRFRRSAKSTTAIAYAATTAGQTFETRPGPATRKTEAGSKVSTSSSAQESGAPGLLPTGSAWRSVRFQPRPRRTPPGPQRRTSTMRESEIEKHLVRRVKELGGECRKISWIGRRGAPDRLVMLPLNWVRLARSLCSAAIWVELKAPGVKPEAYQLREHERMRAMGQRVVVIDSIEGVEGLLS